ncbi:hypothetical protein D3C73_1449380 [compost metagenome]
MLLQRFLRAREAIACNGDLVAFIRQLQLQQAYHGKLILDNQYTFLQAPATSSHDQFFFISDIPAIDCAWI